MADLAGTEKRKRSKKTHRTPHFPPMCKRLAEKSPRRRRKQRIPVLCHHNPKSLGRLKKDVQLINGLYRELRNPRERPRKP